MRRPKWPQLIPPPPREVEQFDLPLKSLLSQALESSEQREARLRKVRRTAFQFYRAVCLHLGEEAAKTLFEGFASKARRMGRPGGSSDRSRDQVMLEVHDALTAGATEVERMALPRTLGELLGPEFGNSAEAREKHIRRLLHQRARRRRLEEARAQRLTPMLGGDATTLLGKLLLGRDTK